MFKDFCPLCGSRFYGDTPEEVYEQIIKHCENGTCEKNFRPLEVALKDTGEDLKKVEVSYRLQDTGRGYSEEELTNAELLNKGG